MIKKFSLIGIFLAIIIGLFVWIFGTPKESKTHLVFSSWGSESEIKIIKPILEDYEKINPTVKIDFLHIPQNYFQKIHLLFASNTEPDVIFINNLYLPIYVNAQVLEPLNKYFTKEELAQFYPQSLNSMTVDGKLYAIPRDVSNLVIFYNKNLFDRYKIKYPQTNWNNNDFLITAKKLTHLPNVFGISFEENPYFYLPFITSEGGSFLPKDYQKKETKDAINFYANLRNKYHVAPLNKEMSGMTSAQLFLQGRLGMLVSGRWVVPKFRQDANFDWDVVNFPKGKAGSISPTDSSGWAISKNSKNKAEAVKFIKYLSSYENITKITKSGLIVPSRIDVSKSKEFNDNEKPSHNEIFIKVTENSIPTPTTTNYNEILDDIKKENEYLFNK